MSIGTKTADYNNYFMALKGNYRKGTNRFRTILANPATAEEYSENLGGCCVVLGWPIGEDDRNSQDLLAMLKESTVISQSVLTWLGQWYSEYNQDADMMYSDAVRCAELEADPLMARAVSMDRIALGKLIVTLSGGDCADYADINAVVSSTEAMTAVAAAPAAMQALIVNADAITAAAASETAYQAIFANAEALGAVVASKPAMEAMIASPSALSAMVASEPVMQTIIGSSIALNAMVTSPVAMKAVAASSTAMAAIIGNSTALNAVVSSQTAMTAVAKAPVAMAAIWKNNTAVQKVQANSTAWATFTGASTSVMGKTVAILAGLNPDDYANMTTIAASSTAMTAVAASSTAMTAVAASSTAMTAVAASQTAMTAVAVSSTAMQAVANSQTALNALAASTTALDALYAKKKRMSGASKALSGKFIILEISSDNAFNTSQYGYATLSDGSKPNWNNYLGKYAYFKQYKKVATYMKNDTDSNDWIDYFQIA